MEIIIMKLKYLFSVLLVFFIWQPVASLAGDTIVYTHPKHRGFHLDWCRTFEHGCGAPAAKEFCQKKGYSVLAAFKKQNNLNVKTMTIGENSICDPQYHNCDSFKWIRCKN